MDMGADGHTSGLGLRVGTRTSELADGGRRARGWADGVADGQTGWWTGGRVDDGFPKVKLLI